jgi:hypothetical protein
MARLSALELAALLRARVEEYEADLAAGTEPYGAVRVFGYPSADPHYAVLVGIPRDVPWVEIGARLAVPALFDVVLEGVTISVDYTRARPVDIAPFVPVVTDATASIAITLVERPVSLHPGTDEWMEAVMATARGERSYPPLQHTWEVDQWVHDEPFVVDTIKRRIRSQITPADIATAAEAYRTDGIHAVRKVMSVSERQAWRYVHEAIEQGLVERKRRRRDCR